MPSPRRHLVVSLLLLLAPLALPSCCTIVTWEAAPALHATRLLGAKLDHDDLLLGVRRSDGRRALYRATAEAFRGLTVFGSSSIRLRDDGDVHAAMTWDYPPDAAGESIALPKLEVLANLPGRHGMPGPVTVRLPPSFPYLSLVDDSKVDDPLAKLSMFLPEEGDVNWIHPGAWLCVLATPVTVAVDVVTFPIQLVYILTHLPHC
jgi:hypothetical protein